MYIQERSRQLEGMKTTKHTVGYSRNQTVIDISREKSQFHSCFIIFLLAPAQAAGDRVYHEK